MSLTQAAQSNASTLEVTSRQPRKKTFPEKVWDMLACFRSVQLAIVLLSLLALATMAGVLLPQEGIVDILQIKRDFGPNYRLFKAMGLFNVYSSYWFVALEVLFFFNLLFGSFQWLKPAFLAATRNTFFSASYIENSPQRLVLQSPESMEATSGRVTAWLRKNRYTVHPAPDKNQGQNAETRLLYATKGNLFRFGAVIVHTGILLMLVSSVYGVFFGFKAQKLAVPGETFALPDSQMFRTNIEPALWLGSIPDWKVRVNDFRIEYYPEGEAPDNTAVVKQYFADLSIINKQGQETKREVISVNHPLAVDDTVLYQASFNPTGKLFVQVDGRAMTLNTNTQFMNRPVSMTELPNGRVLLVFPFFVQQDPDVTRNNVVVFLRDAKGFVGAQPGKMPPNIRLREGQSGTLAGMRFTYVRPEIATGLQIKKGPEVPWMYLSYIIIICGTIMCIFTQRQVWVAVRAATDNQPARLALTFKTKKAKLSFMKELQRLQVDFRNAGYGNVTAAPVKPVDKMPVLT
ncbi:cytochrome c biogenesis protein ResB [Vampirovibrio sp.]|uniref:cytochrome c biogenesis protein ResB n=1 Tax=Vampirovibrio sp. TaxID=2717857 RepID=UPI0035935F22